MAKDKKKKDKKSGKKSAGKAKATLKSIGQSPIVADVVAAALVATAAALKDPTRARALASDTADELVKLSKAGSERGSAMWEMALAIGRRSLETLAKDATSKRQPKATGTTAAAKKSTVKKPVAKKPATRKSGA